MRYLLIIISLFIHSCSSKVNDNCSYGCKVSHLRPEKIVVSLVDVQIVENNHVGNEWYNVIEIDNRRIDIGGSVSYNLKEFESANVFIKIEEANEKYNDFTTDEFTIRKRDLNRKGRLITKSVSLVEKNGRYAGNSAKIDVSVCVCVE